MEQSWHDYIWIILEDRASNTGYYEFYYKAETIQFVKDRNTWAAFYRGSELMSVHPYDIFFTELYHSDIQTKGYDILQKVIVSALVTDDVYTTISHIDDL